MQPDVQQSEKPIGTPEEVRDIGMDIGRFATCMTAKTPESKGCPWYDKTDKFDGCRFLKALGNRKAPVMVGITIINGSNGVAGGVEMPCFDYYYSGLYKRNQWRSLTKDVIKVISIEGDGVKVPLRETRALHPTKDPNCPDCAKNSCKKRVEEIVRRPVEPFPRPGDLYASTALAEQMRAEMENETDIDTDILSLKIPGQETGVAKRKPAISSIS
jgi:hypothetical protein